MENLSHYFYKSRAVVSVLNGLFKLAMWVAKDKAVEIYHADWPAPSIERYVKDATTIWLILHTGRQIDSAGLIADGRVKRIIFPCPKHNPIINLHAKVFRETEHLLATEIRDRTKRAQSIGISVKWTDEAISESMIFLDPDGSSSSRILVDMYLPYLGSSPRPKFEVRSDYHWQLFSDCKTSFNAIWDKANDPKSCEEKLA